MARTRAYVPPESPTRGGWRRGPTPQHQQPRGAPETWSKDTFVAHRRLLIQEKRLIAEATNRECSEACKALYAAEELLLDQADDLDLVVAAAAGQPVQDAQLAHSMRRIKEAFDTHGAAMRALRPAAAAPVSDAKAAAKSDSEEDYEDSAEGPEECQVPSVLAATLKQHVLPAVLMAAFNRLWNVQHSTLHSLPDSVLHLITTKAGSGCRGTCQAFCDAYGSPGAHLACSVKGLQAPSFQDVMSILLAQLRSWRWLHSVRELTLPFTDCDTVTQAVALLPNLRRLSCRARNSRAPQEVPTCVHLTSLTCSLMELHHESAHAVAFPFQCPNLQQLSLSLTISSHPSAPTVSYSAALQELSALSHLHLDICVLSSRGMYDLRDGACREMQRALASRGDSLASLHLGIACSRYFDGALAAGALPQLRSLTLDSWPRLELPFELLQQLTELRLCYEEHPCSVRDEAGHRKLRDLLTAAVAPALRSLQLPKWVNESHTAKATMHAALQPVWPLLPQLTRLTISSSCCATQHDYPAQPNPWLRDLVGVTTLRQLCVGLDLEELQHLSALQQLPGLTHLQVVAHVLGGRPAPAELQVERSSSGMSGPDAGGGPLACLTQLQELHVKVKASGYGSPNVDAGLAAWCQRQCSQLPQVRSLTLPG